MKKVLAKTHNPIVVNNVPHGWADIWLSFTTKPARKTNHYAPTFISRKDLEFDLQFEKEYQQTRPSPENEADIEALEGVLRLLEINEIVIVNNPKYPFMPDIYINKDYFVKQDAEKMIDVFMKHLGYSGAKVKWHKPAGCAGFIIPVSI